MERERYKVVTGDGEVIHMLKESLVNNWISKDKWISMPYQMSVYDAYTGEIYHNCEIVGDNWCGYEEDTLHALVEPTHYMYLDAPDNKKKDDNDGR